MKTIKLIATLKYEIRLIQNEADEYVVYYNRPDEPERSSEPVYDYNIASFLFDTKLLDLQGN